MTALLLLLVLFSLVWLASLLQRDASLVDRFWGLGFIAVAWYERYHRDGASLTWPSALLLALVTIWGLRLSLYLTLRNWGKGEDPRYSAMRVKRGKAFPLWSLFGVFWLQAGLVWVIAQPIIWAFDLSATPARWSLLLAEAGLALWIVGFLFETIGDWQLAAHRADSGRRAQIMDRGLWRYTRHPNYFGDSLVWWGHWLIAAAVGAAWTVFSPVLMTALLLRISGVTLLEKRLTESRPAYRDYQRRTSAFFPWPPRSKAAGSGR
jgi:steroid 5-alpha reductase family enzyme